MEEKTRRKRAERSKQGIAIYEIIILLVSVAAFSYLVSNSLPSVIAVVNGSSTTPPAATTESTKPSVPVPVLVASVLPVRTLADKIFADWVLKNAPSVKTATGATAPTIPTGGTGGLFSKIWTRFTNPKAALSGLYVAAIVVVVIAVYTFIATLIKTGDPARAAEAALRIGIGGGIGALAGYAVYSVFGGPAGWIVGGLAVLGALFSSWLKRETDRDITFTCKPWQAVTGGANCERCNNQKFPCTEYQCRSLGTGCELINKDTDEPRCVWKDPRDVNPPTITPWEKALTLDYRYEPLPPVEGTGVEILYKNDECLPAFQPFTFGIELDKDGYCKIDYQRTGNFSDMRYDFGGSNLYVKQHTQQMSFPGVVHLENEGLNLTNGGEFEFYVRCEAATNGKSNREEFIFKFCVDDGPDTTPPSIRGFNWVDKAPIAYFGENEPREVNVQAYVNEPAKCRWDWQDKNYADMENSLTCASRLINFNAQLVYTCLGKLTGLENSAQNKFYFRCNDTFGNVNVQSKTLTLVGTQPLIISSVGPDDETIKDSTNIIKVTLEAETSAGYNRGESACYYTSSVGSAGYVLFSKTNSHKHSTDLWLGPGNYEYSIRCIDLAGNSDTQEISFRVETDTYAPIIVRAFRDSQNLKIITNEEGTCVYDTVNCEYEFEQGVKMISTGILHTTKWDPSKNFYIKCEDEFGNRPMPNQCSMIVRPFEI